MEHKYRSDNQFHGRLRSGLPGAASVLHYALRRTIRKHTLRIAYANGRVEEYGSGTPPVSAFAFTDSAAERSLLLNPALKLGELYMDGAVELLDGDIHDLLFVLLGNRAQQRLPAPLRAVAAAGSMFRYGLFNDLTRARRNVAHHYDLDGRLYDLFLDRERQYSCAYFERDDMTLEEAQLAKMRRIARKLASKPGQRALDIGSGWGGLALHLAREEGLEVTGITLSEEQLDRSRRRAEDEGLTDHVRFEVEDYRSMPGQFDRVVSVGMLEHVGRINLTAYFRRIAELLAEDGVALIHSIGGYVPPQATNPWISKYIFPGGYIPALSEAIAAVETSGLLVADVEIWRLHYAETLRHWRRRFMENRERAAEIYDEQFCRMWEYYLAGSEASFRSGGSMVFQLVLLRDRTVLPPTRTYMEG